MKNRIFSTLFFLLGFNLSGWLNEVQAQSVITGTLLGHDGKQMKKSIVLMTTGSSQESTIIIQPDEQGRFRYETQGKGLHFLNFVGVRHLQQKFVLYIENPRTVTINVRLSILEYSEDLSTAQLWSSNGKSPFNGKRFDKGANGKFALVLPSNEPFEYLIRRASKSGEAVTGTNAHEYSISYPYGGIFADIFAIENPVNGKVTIILDPEKPANTYKEKSPVSDDLSLDAQLTQIYREINDWNNAAPDYVATQQFPNRILKEKDHLLRQALWIKYLSSVFNHLETGGSPSSDLIEPKIISKAIGELTPASPFWMLRWISPVDFLEKLVLATEQPDRYRDYVERSIESWPYEIRGEGFSSLIKKATKKEDKKDANRLYQRQQVLSPESEAAKFEKLRRERKAGAKVVAGTQVPPFKAHSLGDSTVVYTPQNIKAKIYLIDFWATWCGPCYKEFPYLHAAYEQFHDKGFEILSFSIDPSTEQIFRSRKGKFPMPWLHAIDPQFQTIDSEMAKQFEVFGIPSAFLVNQSGKIIATTEALGKEKLEEMLKDFFDDK
ncbi:MAG: TlpA disulfide reductase family protein [Cyclobacteriaceae bacterium]